MRKSEIIMLGIIVLSFVIAFYFYPQMPAEMASHWNARGEVDGYLPRFWGLFLLPLFSIGLLLLFMVIPKIDPLKANIEKFRKIYDGFVTLIIAFMFYIYILTLLWNLGIEYGMNIGIIPAIGVIFYASGILMENAKRNWFVGIRTPWTLSSERVWNKTHKIGGKLFKISGVIVFFGLFFIDYAIFFIIIPIFTLTGYLIVYSFVEYQKEM